MSKLFKITAEQINDALPQTQCGLCDYDGCKPYADAIVHQQADINLCPPGGVRGLKRLAALTQRDPNPFIEDVKAKEKPLMIAVIREDECIGCVKCIKACPTDAILGAAKQMHTIITDECSGCELCVEPCPVDCIDMIEIGHLDDLSEKKIYQRAKQYRERYEFRESRLEKQKQEKRNKHKKATLTNIAGKEENLEKRKQLILEAVARSKGKK